MYTLHKIKNDSFPENTYIICSKEMQDILFHPNIAGKELQDRMQKISRIFADAMYSQVLTGKRIDQITVLIFLAGGLYYELNSGFKSAFNVALPQCFLGIKRQRIEGTEGEFTAIATYENFESLPNNGTIIVGDTIATGATIQKGIYHLLEVISAKKYNIENIVVCSLACSKVGAELLKEVEKRVKLNFPKAKLYLFVAEELFHLMPDGTDLRFLEKDSLMPDETKKAVITELGEELGKNMKCAVFDWGTRCKNPIKHYHEFLEFAHAYQKQAKTPKAKEKIEQMIDETNRSLEEFEKSLELVNK